MATQRTADRQPRVSFTIDQKMDEDQIRIGRLCGEDDPGAELQREIYRAGIEVYLERLTIEESAKDRDRDRQIREKQIEINEKLLNVLERLTEKL